jgi:protein tyrosine phosphatase (PTP) superfamily phosphohydrolase (DUF442 family)
MMFKEIYHFLQLSDSLFTGGMPTAEQISDAPNHGVEVVINLAPHDASNAIPDEEGLVNSLGMKYINIPVNWGTPTKDGLDKFMDAMDAHRKKIILVHCEANFRASAFVALYRIVRLGWKEENAFEIMHKIWDEDAYPVWKLFIEGMSQAKQG